MNPLLLLVLALSLVGCSRTLPVKGEYNDGGEKFLGSATGYFIGDGDLSIVSETGTKCEGTFRYINRVVNGEGAFKCSDGRIGDFFFTSNGSQGEGFGKDQNGKLFRFKFGGPEYTREAEAQLAVWSAMFDNLIRTLAPTTSYCTQYSGSFRCTRYGY